MLSEGWKVVSQCGMSGSQMNAPCSLVILEKQSNRIFVRFIWRGDDGMSKILKKFVVEALRNVDSYTKIFVQHDEHQMKQIQDIM